MKRYERKNYTVHTSNSNGENLHKNCTFIKKKKREERKQYTVIGYRVTDIVGLLFFCFRPGTLGIICVQPCVVDACFRIFSLYVIFDSIPERRWEYREMRPPGPVATHQKPSNVFFSIVRPFDSLSVFFAPAETVLGCLGRRMCETQNRLFNSISNKIHFRFLFHFSHLYLFLFNHNACVYSSFLFFDCFPLLWDSFMKSSVTRLGSIRPLLSCG